jgi:hypothetical protein
MVLFSPLEVMKVEFEAAAVCLPETNSHEVGALEVLVTLVTNLFDSPGY